MSTMYVIEKPGDAFWNVGHRSNDNSHPYPVLEVEVFVKPPLYKDELFEHRLSLRVIAPAYIAEKWPTLSPRFFEPISGPVRNLTRDEYKALFPDPGRGVYVEMLEVLQRMADETSEESEASDER